MSFDLKSVLPNFFRREGGSFAVPGLCRDRNWSLSDYQVAAEDAFCLVPARCADAMHPHENVAKSVVVVVLAVRVT